ncbi:MAG: NAD(P)H-binding protein [Chloroflexi bacterium]|nr:NAD(P)H-binding protein [Chloroflexota bacterium]
MKVVVIGGTGFLGYHAVLELCRRGHTVTVVARHTPKAGILPESVQFKQADIEDSSEAEIRVLLEGCDGVVFCSGVDDRAVPLAPAYQYFYDGNVRTTDLIFRLANEVGVKRGVLCGSYFTYFDRLWSEKKLAESHPYIKSRREQAKVALAAGKNMVVSVLELPYIFGHTPGKVPLWRPLIKYAVSSLPLFYTSGGTTMIGVEHTAEAIVGALENVESSNSFPVGDVNLTWEEMLGHFAKIAGKNKRVFTLPYQLLVLVTVFVKFYHHLKGKEAGLDPVKYMQFQTINTFIPEKDLAASRAILKFDTGGIVKSFEETLIACGLGS